MNDLQHDLPQYANTSWQRRALRKLVIIALLTLAAMIVLSSTARMPTNLGVRQGRLAPLPDSPNVISTMAIRESQKLPDIPFTSTAENATLAVELAMKEVPRARLISQKPNYLHYEVTSLIFRFVDDVEFLIGKDEKVIHFRSASRVGYSDLGVNRKRMLAITNSLRLFLQEKTKLDNNPKEEK